MNEPENQTVDPCSLPTHSPAVDERTRAYIDSDTAQGGDPVLGAELGKYRILRRLGRGGMGVVFEAEDPLIERHVALKVLSSSSASSPEALERFLREARAAGRLRHPNIVSVYDVDQRDGVYYIVMELVDGGSVSDYYRDGGRFNWREATRVVVDVCEALEAAHAEGLVHRDIKPGNIMLAKDGIAKLTDFGLVKAVGTDTEMTRAGAVVGTPHYMSPEQCRSESVDIRSDLYSVGATYFAMLTGQAPYAHSGTAVQVMFAHCYQPAPDPRSLDPELPTGCVEILRRAMAKSPAERYPSAQAMKADLEALLAGEPLLPAPWMLASTVEHVDAEQLGRLPKAPRSWLAPWVRIAVWGAVAAALVLVALALTMERDYALLPPEPPVAPLSAPEAFETNVTVSAVTPALDRAADRGRGSALYLEKVVVRGPSRGTPAPATDSATPWTNSLGMRFVTLPLSTMTDSKAGPDEMSPSSGTIARPFAMAVHEVTQRHYALVMGPLDIPAAFLGADLPMTHVTYDEAVFFCKRLSDQPAERAERRRYRLPTEAEWEYAARAGTTTKTAFGDRLTARHAHHAADGASEATPRPSRPVAVGSFPPNPWGVFDMHGNVAEWCADPFDDTQAPRRLAGKEPAPARRYAVRGGSWVDGPEHCTSFHRIGIDESARLPTVGFRVVCELD